MEDPRAGKGGGEEGEGERGRVCLWGERERGAGAAMGAGLCARVCGGVRRGGDLEREAREDKGEEER